MSKVSVNIYGKEYTIVGEQSPEQIAKVAALVDTKMKEIGEAASGAPMSTLAVLTAVNISDEYYRLRDKKDELERLNNQYEADTQHYVQLWEEAKKSFTDYKRDSQNEIEQLKQTKDQLYSRINEKEREVDAMKRNQGQYQEAAMAESAKAVKEAESKYNDLENNYFDLQMENIRLKSELEKLRSSIEWKNNDNKGY